MMSPQLWYTHRPPTPVLVCHYLFGSVMPIAEMAIGAVYLHECPRQPYIPIYLIVLGVFSLMLNLLSCLPCTRQSEDGTIHRTLFVYTKCNVVASLLLICWFIAGNVWIYSIYQPSYNKDAADPDLYCNKTLYLFAFWITTLGCVFLGEALLGACCTLCCFFLCGLADPDPECWTRYGQRRNTFRPYQTTADVKTVCVV